MQTYTNFYIFIVPLYIKICRIMFKKSVYSPLEKKVANF